MFAPTGKGSLFYTEEGSNNPFPVIFIHGFPFSHHMWHDQLKLVGKSYRAIAYDVRGHGKTDTGDGQYMIESHVDDLLQLMAHLKINSAVIVGLSMGGYIALRAVEKNPISFCGLVLCDTKSEADGNEAKIKRYQSMQEVKSKGTDEFLHLKPFPKNLNWPKLFDIPSPRPIP
jgi:3-oxoadipate enol-lactonase